MATRPRHTAIPRDAYIPFSSGARKCAGDTFALTHATLILATITARWHLQPLPDHHVRPTPAVALRPRELRMRAAARTPVAVSATGCRLDMPVQPVQVDVGEQGA
jgi:cytochrome P450